MVVLASACRGGEQPSPPAGTPEIGDVVGDGVWEVRVREIRFADTLDGLPATRETFTAEEGYTFLVVEAEVRNLVDDKLYFSTDSFHLVEQPLFQVSEAALAEASPGPGWFEGSISTSMDGSKAAWAHAGVAFAVKEVPVGDFYLRFRDLPLIRLDAH